MTTTCSHALRALVLLLAAPVGWASDLTVAELESIRDEVLSDVEELRGGKFERPVAVQLTTAEGFVEYAQARTNRLQTAQQRAAEEQVAKFLGLIPSEMDLEAKLFEFVKGQVGGFYEPSEETFYVVSSYDEPGVLRVILVHELTHALDDQLFGIDERLVPLSKTNSDAALAFHAVVEGSGTSVMNQWMLPRLGSGEVSMADMQKAAASSDFGDAPEYIWLPLMHSYLMGAAFLARTESVMAGQTARPPTADLDRAFRNPPLSTEQVLHPEKYWDEELRDDPRVVSIDASELEAGWTLLKEDTLGELGLALLTHAPEDRKPFSPFAKFTREAAEGWGGDRYALLGKGDARVLHLVTSWDTIEDADEFGAAVSSLSDHLRKAAESLGQGLGGFRWEHGENSDELRLTLWSGVDEPQALRVAATLRAGVVPGR